MRLGRQPGSVQGVQEGGSHNKQWNYFAPVTQHIFTGSFERLKDVCFDPAPLARDLDLDRFTGREWLIEEIDEFIGRCTRGYILIQAEAGVGKSTLAAHVVATRRWLHHFTRLPGGRNPEAARKSLAAQLIARCGLLKEWAPEGILPAAASPSDWFARLLDAAARQRDANAQPGSPREPIVLVVDGLDEAEPERPADTALPLGLPDSLPDGVFIVATSRFGMDRALHAVRRPADWLQIEVEGADNLADMNHYLQAVTAPDGGDGPLVAALRRDGVDAAWFCTNAAVTCAGVWIYLRYLLDEIREGDRSPRSVDKLPGDLAGYYAEQIERWRGSPDDEAAQRRWEQVRLPLLGVLGAAREPLPVAELTRFAAAPPGEKARAFIEETARAFLNQRDDDAVPCYALRHQSLRDLLTERLPDGARQDLASVTRILANQAAAAHRQITAALTPPGTPAERNWADATPYAIRNLAAHAAASGQLDALVCDPGFLLTADPDTIVANRDSARGDEAVRAFAAFDLSRHDRDFRVGWSTPGESLALLTVNAARMRAAALLSACVGRSAYPWQVRWAGWNGQGHRQLTAVDDPVYAVAIGTVGAEDVIVSGSDDGFTIWNLVSAMPPYKIGYDRASARAVAMGRLTAADGRDVIITGTDKGLTRIWDASGSSPIAELPGHSGPVIAVAFGNCGDRDVIVTGSSDSTARLWNAATREHIVTFEGHTKAVTAAAIGRLTTGDRRDVIITGSADATARIWDATGNQAGPALLLHQAAVTGVAFGSSGDRDVIVTCAEDMTAAIWDAATGEHIAMLSPRDVAAGNAIAISDGIIVTGSGNSSANVWDAASGRLKAMLTGHHDTVTAVAIGRLDNRTVIVTGSKDKSVRVWDAVAGWAAGVPPTGHEDLINALAFGRLGDRDIVVSGSADSTAQLWDAVTGQHLVTLRNDSPVNTVAAGRACGRDLIITGSPDGTAQAWDPSLGKRIGEPLVHRGPVNAVAVGRASSREIIVTGSADCTAGIWDAATHELIAILSGHQGEVTAVSMMGLVDGQDVIVTGSADCTAAIWDAVTGDQVGAPLRGHMGAVTTIATSQVDGRDVILTGSSDGTVQFWNAAGERFEALGLGPVEYVSAARIGERNMIVVCNEDGKLRVCWWKAADTSLTTLDCFDFDQAKSAGPVALGQAGGRPLLVCRSADSTVLAYEYHGPA
jgi:WD40 repeat protein